MNLRPKTPPKISLCIPNYNRAEDLIQVVEDLQNQTVAPYEIIINDDLSDEKNMQKIRKHIKPGGNLKIYINKKNMGLAANCSEAAKKARGEYVALVNNDDRVSPRYVEQIMQAIEQHPGYNVYATNAIGMTEEKKIVGDYRLLKKSGEITKKTGIKRLFNYYFLNLITISGATFYKTSFMKKVLFDPNMGNEADLDFAMKLLATENIMYVDVPIYFVRMHSDSTSRKIRLETDRLIDNITRCMRIYKKYPTHKKYVPLYIERIQAMYILQLMYKYHFSAGRVKKILNISSNRELLISTLMIPWLLGAFFIRKLSVEIYRTKYLSFAPKDIQNAA